jgi:hypothetical protein
MIWLILGLSGAEKSSFGEWLATKRNWLHLETDVFNEDPDADGINLHNLRSEWDDFFERRNAKPLRETLQKRLQAESRSDAVLTFPSNWVPSREHIDAALQEGIRTIFLYGSKADCLRSFLLRQKKGDTKLKTQHWRRNNSDQHALMGQSQYDAHRVQVFGPTGNRRSHVEVFAELLQGASRPAPRVP